MRSGMRGLSQVVSICAVLAVVAAVAVWQLDTASGQNAEVRVVAPSSVAVGSDFEVRIEIQGAPPPDPGCPTDTPATYCGLGSYEWLVAYDPALLEFKGAANDEFLTSTSRTLGLCSDPEVGPSSTLSAGQVKFGCNTTAFSPSGPEGSGVLSRLTFSAKAQGAGHLDLGWVSLSDWEGGIDVPASRQGTCVVIGSGSTCVTPTTAPPASPTPPVVGTPPATATPGPGDTPAPTPTPTGPTPTPTPLPPGMEALPLFNGCQFQTWTGDDGTTPDELAGLVGPAGSLTSLWAQQPPPVWRGYSPEFPHVSDMEPLDLLDVVAICMTGPGDFVRPII